MDYNKEGHKLTKSRAIRTGSGPRDLQQRNNRKSGSDGRLIEALQDQIKLLTQQLANGATKNPTALYSAEEFDEELNKTLIKVTKEMEAKHASTIKTLKEEVNQLRSKLEAAQEPASGPTPKEVDALVSSKIDEALASLKEQHNKETASHLEKIASIKQALLLAENKVIDLKKQLLDQQTKITELDKVKTSLAVTKSQLANLKESTALSTEDAQALRSQIDTLKQELHTTKTALAVAQNTVEAKQELIKTKDDIIISLRDRPVNVKVTGNKVEADNTSSDRSDRPKMDQVFIDPSENKKDTTPHLKFEDVKVAEREVMSSKVDKLKSIMGSLPNK